MRLTKRLEAVETALAKELGEGGIMVVIRLDGETDDECRTRLGLDDWPGLIIFGSETDVNL